MSIPEGETGSDESKGCWKRYRKAYATEGNGKRRNIIKDNNDRCCIKSATSVRCIVILNIESVLVNNIKTVVIRCYMLTYCIQ